jgi:DNA-binding LytR/AlgR family response regulator
VIRCVIVDDDEVSRAVLERFVREHGDLELTATCASAVEAVRVLRGNPVDLLYLDVEMPEMSGLDLVRALEPRPEVILVTGNQAHAVEAFRLEVTDFLVNPIDYPSFLRATERACRRAPPPADPVISTQHLFVRFDGRLTKLDLRDVIRVEARGDNVRLHTAARVYEVTSTMKAIEAALPSSDFVRVHRSHIVRIDRIVDIEETNLVIGRDVVPVSASYRPVLLSRLRTL